MHSTKCPQNRTLNNILVLLIYSKFHKNPFIVYLVIQHTDRYTRYTKMTFSIMEIMHRPVRSGISFL